MTILFVVVINIYLSESFTGGVVLLVDSYVDSKISLSAQ